MRKVFITAKIKLVVNMDDGVEVADVIAGLEVSTELDSVDIIDHTVSNVIVTDSK